MTNINAIRPVYRDDRTTLYEADALRVLAQLPDSSVHAVVCDPPYAIRATRDPAALHRLGPGQDVPDACGLCAQGPPAVGHVACARCLRGMRVAAYGGSEMLGQQSANWHEKATHSRGYADNDNESFGRWVHLWAVECERVLKPGGHLVAFGGTRTWHRLAVSVEDAGFEMRDSLAWLYGTGFPKSLDAADAVRRHHETTGTATGITDDASGDWEGWGTALKPAHEPIVLARKPLAGTVGMNLAEHGTGAMNVNGARLTDDRWPSNVFLDEDQAVVLDAGLDARPSRFFWVAKPDRRERVRVNGHSHPTVKPLRLMRELVRLVTPPNGTVLDPFAGSGTTMEACLMEGVDCIAIEKDADHIPLIRERIRRHREGIPLPFGIAGDVVSIDTSSDPEILALF